MKSKWKYTCSYGVQFKIRYVAQFIEYLNYKNIKGVTIYWFGDDTYYNERVHSVDLKTDRLTTFRVRFLTEEMFLNKS